MIWNNEDNHLADETAFCDDLLESFVEAARADEDETRCLREVAFAITRVWSDDLKKKVRSDRLFWLLGSQACWNAGHRRIAERLLARLSLPEAESGAVMGLVRSRRLTVRTGTGVATRLVRPSHVEAGPKRDVWTLDLVRAFGPDLRALDLLVAPRLRCVVEQLSELWDGNGGEGALILDAGAAGELVPPHAVLREIADYCVAVLRRLRETRGWKSVPQVRLRQSTG